MLMKYLPIEETFLRAGESPVGFYSSSVTGETLLTSFSSSIWQLVRFVVRIFFLALLKNLQ